MEEEVDVEKLKKLMAARGWNEFDLLAELRRQGCKVAPITIGRWFAGESAPRLVHIQAIARAVECSIDDIAPPVAV